MSMTEEPKRGRVSDTLTLYEGAMEGIVIRPRYEDAQIVTEFILGSVYFVLYCLI